MSMSDIERQAAIQASVATFVPPVPEASENFPPLISRAEHKVVSTRDYAPKSAPGTKVSGQLAVNCAEDDNALDGWRLVEVKGEEAIFERDDNLQAQANLRKDYQAYRESWGHGAALRRWNGAPVSPMEYVRRVIAGEPLLPVAEAPEVIDPAEKRIRDLEATVARLEGMTAKLPG
jgi:hypothetical protein